MAVTLNKLDDTHSLLLTGNVDIAEAAELKCALMDAFASSLRIRIQLAGADSLDVTAVQLLQAAVTHAKSTGTDLMVQGPLREAIKERFVGTGLFPLLEALVIRSQEEVGCAL